VSEDFLTRWSRRKREAEQAAPPPSAAPAGVEPGAVEKATENVSPRAEEASPARAGDEPTVDIAALPPIESITATTDVRAFLARGVPAQLTRAALRRAWAADPAIRDFVGLAENAWDFTAPDAMPGFGPLVGPASAQQIAADAMGDAPARPSPAPASFPDGDESEQEPQVGDQPEVAPRAAHPDVAAQSNAAEREGVAADPQSKIDAAVRNEQAADEPPKPPGRRHGGALPG